jgi:dipeptidyl-peptidase 4
MIPPASRARRACLAAALVVAALRPAAAATPQKNLTIDDLYDPDKKLDFDGNPPKGLVWIDDAHYLWPKTDGKDRTTELLKVEAVSGKAEPLFDEGRMEKTLAGLEGISPEEAKRVAHLRTFTFNPAHTVALLTLQDDLYHYDLRAHHAVRLTREPGREEEAALSPDGARVAFVRGLNLYVVDVATQRERSLTTDGSPDLLNGKLDWVYQEEIYGRGKFRAFWWSPDSSLIAFLQLDEKNVPRYTIVDDIAYRPEPERYAYPKSGDANPAVRLGVVPATGGPPRWVDTGKYGTDLLITDVSWTPDGRQVVFEAQDREQTWLDLDVADAAGHAPLRTLFRETSKAWVDNAPSPRWLKDGSFLWLSERTGFKHLYHFRADGTLLRPVTSGEWEVRTLHGVDEAGGWIYFSGTERSPIGGDVFRVRLDGSGRERLSTAAGTHVATFNPAFSLYIDSWSNVTTPPQVRLHRADGTEARTIDANPVEALGEYRLSKPEHVQVKTRDGFVMEAFLIKPPDFDPAKKYPVYQHTYGGPHAQTVKDAWEASHLFLQMLAQKGIVVWLCDNRTASGKGVQSTWPAYLRFGETELPDIEDGLAWLVGQGFVDPARIGINGWSYGGFMVSYALTHSKTFAMGIAGGTVSDWRDYDSIYTERYMKTPEHNPDGYRRSSPRFAAKDLHGQLLLMHGAIDDNVHPQNTMQLVYELQKAGKPFRLMLYPKSRHAVSEPALVKHLRAGMLDFIEQTLLR